MDEAKHKKQKKQLPKQAAERRAGVETLKQLRDVQAIQESKAAAQEGQTDIVRLMT